MRARFTLYQVHDDAFLHTVCVLSRDEKRKKYDEINNVAEYKPRASLQFSWDYFVHNMTLYVRNCFAICNKFKIVPCLLRLVVIFQSFCDHIIVGILHM